MSRTIYKVTLLFFMLSLMVHAWGIAVLRHLEFSSGAGGITESGAALQVERPRLKATLPDIEREQIKDRAEPEPIETAAESIDTAKPQAVDYTGDVVAEMDDFYSPAIAEFFGTGSTAKRICFVVDCSGSLFGVFDPVREELANCIYALSADQYFCVVAFGGKTLRCIPAGRLIRAAPSVRTESVAEVDQLKPAGRTNAAAALEYSFSLRDSSSRPVETVYFLTDGLDLDGAADYSFIERIMHARSKSAPRTVINTIAFRAQSSDSEILKELSRKTGGEFRKCR